MKVLKFGGTSVGKPERMHEVARLITKDGERKLVVLSAVSGTTNSLLEIGDLIGRSAHEAALKPSTSCTKAIEYLLKAFTPLRKDGQPANRLLPGILILSVLWQKNPILLRKVKNW
jgi:aspartate kinase